MLSKIQNTLLIRIVAALDDNHLNQLIKIVPKKSQGMVSLKETSPKRLRDLSIKGLLKNNYYIYKFLSGEGFNDIVDKYSKKFSYLSLDSMDDLINEMNHNKGINYPEFLLYLIKNKNKEELDNFFKNDEINIEIIEEKIKSLIEDDVVLSDAEENSKQQQDEKAEINKLSKENDDLKKEVLRIKGKKTKLENEINKLNQKIQKLNNKYDSRKKKSDNDIKIKIDQMKNSFQGEIDKQRDELKQNELTISVLENENKELKNKNNDLEKRNESLSYEVKKLNLNLNKKKVIVLGKLSESITEAYPNYFFVQISKEELDINRIREELSKQYEKVFLLSYQISTKMTREIKRHFPEKKIIYINTIDDFELED
ncbi:hypothetical protein IGI75_000428 [Enterococcus sp. DIV2469a]|uniref:coiled-coil domain-containing protein n=1 Tax=Enterococcus TaxID=1350 RepID=UPI002FDC29F7